MEHKYDIYRPRPTVNDVVDTSRSYYHSPDIALSPFSAVGSLAGFGPRAGRSTADTDHANGGTGSVHLTAHSPVFRNFKQIRPQDISDTHSIPVRRTKRAAPNQELSPQRVAATPVTPMLSSAWARLIMALSSLEFAPKKYQVDTGTRVNYNTRTFAIARWTGPALAALSIVAVLLLAVLNPGGLIQKSGSHPPKFISSLFESGRAFAQSGGTTGSTKTSGTSGQSSGTVTTSSSLGRSASSTAISSTVPTSMNTVTNPVTTTTSPIVPVVTSPIIGGMGGGPTTTTPVPITTPPPVISPVVEPITQQVTNTTTTVTPPVLQPVTQPVTNLIQDVTAPVTSTLGL